MVILVDLIVIALLLLSTFLGYKKGLIGVAFKIVSFIIAIVITLILFNPISNLIMKNTPLQSQIENVIYEKLASTKVEEGEKIDSEDTNMPSVIVNYINDSIENTVEEAKDNVASIISKKLSETIIKILVAIAIFIIVRILLIFAKVLLEAIAELPIVKQFNEAGGIIYGILRGLIIIYILLAIASVVLPMVNATNVIEIIDNTIITKFLYNHNIILRLFF